MSSVLLARKTLCFSRDAFQHHKSNRAHEQYLGCMPQDKLNHKQVAKPGVEETRWIYFPEVLHSNLGPHTSFLLDLRSTWFSHFPTQKFPDVSR